MRLCNCQEKVPGVLNMFGLSQELNAKNDTVTFPMQVHWDSGSAYQNQKWKNETYF